jgi:hypothetical protein
MAAAEISSPHSDDAGATPLFDRALSQVLQSVKADGPQGLITALAAERHPPERLPRFLDLGQSRPSIVTIVSVGGSSIITAEHSSRGDIR